MMSIIEQAKYSSINKDTLIDLITELQAYRDVSESCIESNDTPEELQAYITKLEDNQANPDHADYTDYKQFFLDCVDRLNKSWPCAEVTDQTLQQVIFEAIEKGDSNE